MPEEWGKLSKLQKLYLGYNELVGPIPSSFGQLGELRVLNVPSNSLSGDIPSSLGNLSGKLESLILYATRRATDPPEQFDNPGLSGCIPS